MKKLKCALASILICLTACLCGACSTDEEAAPLVTQNTQTFITIVSQIQDSVKVDDGSKIEVALLVYDYLNDAEKGNPDVVTSKARLDDLKSKYDVVKAEADKNAEIAREEKLVSDFISEVESLSNKKLKLSDRETIDALIEKYAQLKAESKQQSKVVEAYGKLMDADLAVLALEEAARAEEVKTTAGEFIEAVQEVLAAIDEAEPEDRDGAILSSRATLEKLLYAYADFDNDVKNYNGVAEAKASLDEIYAEYGTLRDAADVKEFLELVKALKPIEEKVTLENETALTQAETAYRFMSDEARAADGVAEAYAVLQQAREHFDVLFAAAEAIKIEQFIEAASKVGTDIENVDIDWFDVLDAASRAYKALDYDSYSIPEVKEAFERWNAAQSVFDKKGYKQITMSDPNVIFSGHAVNPMIVLQNEYNMINPLLDFYNVQNLNEIADKVTVWLNVYVDGEYVGRGALSVTLLAHEIGANHIQEVLSGLSAQNSSVVNGGSFSFSLNFEDKNNEFIPSAKTKVSASKVYNW